MENKNMINVVLDFLSQVEVYWVLTGMEAGIYNKIRKN